jgi:hypothetical protein
MPTVIHVQSNEASEAPADGDWRRPASPEQSLAWWSAAVVTLVIIVVPSALA